MPGRPYILAESTWVTIREKPYEVAVLPWGATEAHNYHLPYATDNIESEAIAAEAARIAWERGTRVVVLPTVPFGVNTGQLDIPLCLNMNPSTQAALLSDVAVALEPQGVRKLVILNGHGGNDFRQMIRELQPRVKLFLCTINWWTLRRCHEVLRRARRPRRRVGDERDAACRAGSGAAARRSGEGSARRFRVRGLREGWAWAPRQWTQVTDDTGVGNPAAATAAKGARISKP